MDREDDYDHIESLKRKLYGRGSGVSKKPRTRLSPRYDKIKTDWLTDAKSAKTKKYLGLPFLTKLLIGSIIFFLLALAAAGFVIFSGGNTISNRNIDLTIKGPATARAGDEMTFQVLITNRNNAALEEVELIIEYPEDSKVGSQTIRRSREMIGLIRPGQTINKTAKVILFGRENTEKEITAILGYRQPASNAFFEKTAQAKFLINSPPLSLVVKTLPEIVSGQTADLEIEIVSNAETVLSDVILTASYPLGFSSSGANLPPTFNDNVWRLGNLAPGEKKNIKIAGRLSGQDQEIKTFVFSVGRESNLADGAVVDLYNERLETITIKRPFIATDLVINGKILTAPAVALGEPVRVDVTWINNLATPVIDAVIELTLDGEIVDRSRVTPGDGFYRSAEDLIFWNKNRLPALGEIKPSQSGQTSFTFATKKLTDAGVGTIVNPAVNLDLVIKGVRISPGFSNETVESRLTKQIKVESNFQLAARALYHIGPFTNTGPLPPKVDTETTYTIVWSLANSSNRVTNAEVKAILPPTSRFLGTVNPGSADISYNESAGEIIWRAEQIDPAAGSGSGIKEAAFQIGFTPSANQVGRVVDLIGNMTLTGSDVFTGTVLESNHRPINTRLSTDPNFQAQQATVAP